MIVIIIMSIGLLIGYFVLPVRLTERFGKINSWIQLVLVCILIFTMGIKLGSRENFWKELVDLGWKSFVLAVLPIIMSIALVYPLTKRFVERHVRKENVEEEI